MGKNFGKKAVVAGCIGMAAVALLVTVLTLQGILALGRDDSGTGAGTSTDSASSADAGMNSGADVNADAVTGAVNEDGGQGAVAAAADGNWGLSFQQEGKSPIGNATGEYLKKYNAYYIGDERSGAGESGQDAENKEADAGAGETGEKAIYLTFDAGYENGYTATLLDVLKEEKVPAAFFVVGNFIEENPELVKRMTKEGHIVGNHTMHHPDMSAISDEAGFRKEMSELEAAYKKAVGRDMLKFYRPPQGKYSESNLEMANRMGYTTVFWSLAYVDWLQDSQPSREEALNILNKRIHPGAIVLLHSTSKTNAEILRELLQGWKAQGYVFKPISELGVEKL